MSLKLLYFPVFYLKNSKNTDLHQFLAASSKVRPDQSTETRNVLHFHVNRLKEWLAKQSEKEHEREQRRQERLARRRAMPNHKFDDPTYDQQRALLAESQEEALNEGSFRNKR